MREPTARKCRELLASLPCRCSVCRCRSLFIATASIWPLLAARHAHITTLVAGCRHSAGLSRRPFTHKS